MEADRGKLFVGGIGRDTTVEQLREYFESYGEVSNVSIVKEKITGRPRGFGFVSFSDASVLDRVLKIKHVVRNRTVEVKQALLREENKPSASRGNGKFNVGQCPGGGGGYFRTRKIFVGGLPAMLTENEFREYFGRFGVLTDVVIVCDQNTRRPRGFGFISFNNEDSVDRVLSKTFHELKGKLVEVKRAQPKYSGAGSGRSSEVRCEGPEFYGPPDADVRFYGQNTSSKFPHLHNTIHGFHPTCGYGAPLFYSFSGFGGYGVGNYVFGAPMGARAYQPPYIPVGYGVTSYVAGPVMTSRFPNVVGYENQGYVHGSYITNDVSPFSGLTDDRAQSANVFNIAGGGGKGVVHDR